CARPHYYGSSPYYAMDYW
nr:immunoglobulin heavy chain junction region [Mus musculus]NSM03710.1 immunoglobulin heavy chain junction region [Mus musculus]NSM03761.1 immunoglobulin heavy chain junction region [Mus musculus]NSM04099.1 immunoglobulin heavy chain junction region [Mus musculus]NSM04109.1 immunoglobulin heavy chain junction region [Mus musculus]